MYQLKAKDWETKTYTLWLGNISKLCSKNNVKKKKTGLREVVKDLYVDYVRSSRPEVFLWRGVLKIWSKFTGEHPCQSAICATLLKSHFGMGVLL